MLIAVLLVGAVIAAGTLASYLYDDEAPLVSRVGFGAVTGLAVVALVGFVLANAVGIAVASQVALVLALLSIALLLWTPIRGRAASDVATLWRGIADGLRRPSLRTTGYLAYAAIAGVFLWFVFERVVVADASGISTGYPNNLGDLPFHMQVTASFAYSGNFPPEDPTYAGTGFAYPYMADFLSAMLVSLGASIDGAFFLQNLVLGAALVIVIHRFARVLTGDSLAALIAPPLLLLSGGLGWTLFLQEAGASEQGLVAYLGALPHDYTIGVAPYRWGNAITTLLVTQRSLAFGLPLSIVVFIQLWRLIHAPPVTVGRYGDAKVVDVRRLRPGDIVTAIRQRPEALAAGLFTGLLPLIHAHSFIVAMGTAFLFGVLFRQWRDGKWLPWAVYVIAALAIGLPEIWWSTHDSHASAGTFFGIELGWDHGDENILIFWLLNTGLFLPLALIALFSPNVRSRAPKGLALFTIAFLTWFLIPNVVKLAPWVWDNIKVLFYWYVGFVPLVALLIAWLLRDRRVAQIAGVALLATLVLAGSIDVWRVVSGQTKLQEFDPNAIAIAEDIRRDTPERAMILHAPTWNPAVFLTGRRSLLGYTGYIWAHGLDYAPREADIKRIYAGEADAEALLTQYGVEYILVSPTERGYMSVNDEFFNRFREVAAAGEYRLLQVVAS